MSAAIYIFEIQQAIAMIAPDLTELPVGLPPPLSIDTANAALPWALAAMRQCKR